MAWPSSASLSVALDEAAIIAITDPGGAITHCNQRFCDVSGYDKDELIGANHRILNSGFHDRDFFKSLYFVIARGGVWRGTIRNRRKDGSLYWVDTTIVPTMGPDGRPEHYTSIRFEVTEHVQALADLAEARSQAERAVQTKDKFIANMSHEVRTPLNGVIGLAGALSGTPLTQHQAGMVDLILKSGEALRRILDDILDLSKIHADQMPLILAPFDLREEVSAAAELMRVRADEKGLGFQVLFSECARGWFRGDAIRMRQIISNLASNAVKFTEKGEVVIKIDLDETQGEAILRINIEDTGIGFDSTVAARLFVPFVQADDSIARRYGGTGLGLSVCRELAELMGGRIEGVGELGVGSRFIVHLPLERIAKDHDAPSPAAPMAAPRHDQLKILLAEDHPTNQKVVEFLLHPFDIDLTIAKDGAEALSRFESEAFDIILMDMQMPIMDGLTAIREIRALEVRRGAFPIPIAMMTANTSETHHQQAATVGADGFIAKPVTLESLMDGINSLVALRVERPSAALS